MKTINNWELTLEQFVNRTRTHVSVKLENIGHAYNRNIERRFYTVYVNTDTLKTFNPKTIEDCTVCKSFSSDHAHLAKEKAYNYIIETMKGY